MNNLKSILIVWKVSGKSGKCPDSLGILCGKNELCTLFSVKEIDFLGLKHDIT